MLASAFSQMNRAVTGPDGHEISAAVQFAANFVLANFTFGGDRHIEINVTVAGVEIDVRGHVSGNFQGHVAVAGFEAPGCGQRGASGRAHFHVAIAGLEVELIEAAVGAYVAVSGGGAQLTIDCVENFGTVSATEIHLALEAADFDLAIVGAEIHFSLAWHVDHNVDAALAPVDDDAMRARKAYLKLDQVTSLVLLDFDAALADLVAHGSDCGFDGVLVPGFDADVGIGGFDAQVGSAGEMIGFRPFVGAG